jgi:hypothetical protein
MATHEGQRCDTENFEATRAHAPDVIFDAEPMAERLEVKPEPWVLLVKAGLKPGASANGSSRPAAK